MLEKRNKLFDPTCKDCALCFGAQRVSVPGQGYRDADVMLVLDKPCMSTDATGKVLYGAAGDLLNEALEEAGLNRGEVWLTHAVKCHTKRFITQQEIDTCSQYLYNEVMTVQPKVVVTLGRTGFNALTGTNVPSFAPFHRVPIPQAVEGVMYKVYGTYSPHYLARFSRVERGKMLYRKFVETLEAARDVVQ